MPCTNLEPHLLSLRQAQKVYSMSDQMATVRPNSLHRESVVTQVQGVPTEESVDQPSSTDLTLTYF